MMGRLRFKLLPCLLLPALNGCLIHTRQVQQAKLPAVVQNATADQLVAQINQVSDELESVSATVDIQPSVGGELKGKVTDYPAFSGYILLKKPDWVRVVVLVPVLRTHAVDLASGPNGFKVYIPSKNKVTEGSNSVGKPSANALENLRPSLFFQAMIPPRIGADELVTLTHANVPEIDPVTHVSATIPEYALAVMRQKAHSQELIQKRVVHFSRVDLLPARVDSYNEAGALETVTLYSGFQDFDGMRYPKTITIQRPIEEYQIVITIDKLIRNPSLTDEQFELKLPDGVQVEKLP